MIAINGQKAEGVSANGQTVSGIAYGGEVIYKTEGFVQVESIKSTPASVISLPVGQTATITITFTPDNATDKSITIETVLGARFDFSYDIDTGKVLATRRSSGVAQIRFTSNSNPEAFSYTVFN